MIADIRGLNRYASKFSRQFFCLKIYCSIKVLQMNCTITTAFKVPSFKKEEGEETKLSKALRITAVVLGLLAIAAGALALLNVAGIAQMGCTAAWSLLSAGAAISLLGTALKGIRKETPQLSPLPPYLRDPFDNSDETTTLSSSYSSTSACAYETELSTLYFSQSL